MIKDEQRYLREFIEFYTSIGIDDIILFEDINSTSHKEITDQYPNVKLYKFIDVCNEQELNGAFNGEYRIAIMWHIFKRKFSKNYDAVLYIDIDEFLDCNKEEFLSYINKIYAEGKHAVKFRWITMTANGHIEDPGHGKEYSLIETYTKPMTKRYIDMNDNGKPLLFVHKMEDNEFANIPHGPLYVYNLPETAKKFYDTHWAAEPPFKLRHYLTKSWEEYCNRLFVRGEMDNNAYSRKLHDFFEINEDLKDKESILTANEQRAYKYNEI